MKSIAYLTLAVMGVCLINPASAADFHQELQQLREDVQILQRQVYRSNETARKADNAGSSEVQGKITEYDETIRSLNGRMDELENAIKQTDAKLDKINRDIEIRFKVLEGRQIPAELSAPAPKISKTYDAPVAQGAAASVVGDSIRGTDLAPIDGAEPQELLPDSVVPPAEIPTGVVNANNPKEMYQNALHAYESGFLDEAELGFEDILKQFPQHNLASNAQYWLGEVYTRQGNLEKAKAAFKDGYEKYKNGNKAADSLFKLGYTFNKVGDKNRACIVYMSFGEEFPKAPAELTSKVKAEIKRLGCK